MADNSREFKYEIKEQIACISTKGKWSKELNIITWGDGEPKYDLRSWNEDHSKMGKGISLTKEEVDSLRVVLNKLDD